MKKKLNNNSSDIENREKKIANGNNFQDFGIPYFPNAEDIKNFLTNWNQVESINKKIKIEFVKLDNQYIQLAKKISQEKSGCSYWNTGAVITGFDKNGSERIISKGANEGKKCVIPCPRFERSCASGTGYKLCKDICYQDSHAEVNACNHLPQNHLNKYSNIKLYLFGHYWCCQSCWQKMIQSEIYHVLLPENAQKIFSPSVRKLAYQKICQNFLQAKAKIYSNNRFSNFEKETEAEKISRRLSQW
ncbi:MAG: hypothetical protein ACOZAR_00995 [Patescibacteria group bacterium]